MAVKKLKRLMLKETLQQMVSGQDVFFTRSEAEEGTIRATVARMHRGGSDRYAVNKTSQGCKVTKL